MIPQCCYTGYESLEIPRYPSHHEKYHCHHTINQGCVHQFKCKCLGTYIGRTERLLNTHTMKHIPIWVEKLQATNERETNGIFNNPTSSEFRSQSQQRKCIQSYLYQLKPTILKICRGICYKKNVCYYYANRDLVVGLKLPQRNNVCGSFESTMMESEYVKCQHRMCNLHFR